MPCTKSLEKAQAVKNTKKPVKMLFYLQEAADICLIMSTHGYNIFKQPEKGSIVILFWPHHG